MVQASLVRKKLLNRNDHTPKHRCTDPRPRKGNLLTYLLYHRSGVGVVKVLKKRCFLTIQKLDTGSKKGTGRNVLRSSRRSGSGKSGASVKNTPSSAHRPTLNTKLVGSTRPVLFWLCNVSGVSVQVRRFSEVVLLQSCGWGGGVLRLKSPG